MGKLVYIEDDGRSREVNPNDIIDLKSDKGNVFCILPLIKQWLLYQWKYLYNKDYIVDDELYREIDYFEKNHCYQQWTYNDIVDLVDFLWDGKIIFINRHWEKKLIDIDFIKVNNICNTLKRK